MEDSRVTLTPEEMRRVEWRRLHGEAQELLAGVQRLLAELRAEFEPVLPKGWEGSQ